jgi:hypothetical protein
MQFDRQEWERLARDDPQEFDRRRHAAVAAAIARAPERLQERLRALQCRVDLELRRAGTPLAGTLRLHALMWDQFEAMRAALNGARPPKPGPDRLQQREGKVVPFEPRSPQSAR